ncbi:MAG TPA: DUF736 domain-containing protein [Terracidiphilus sp.]|jgi:uncharacterized protein (DUF736 family)|nr:DUF736 domain-containing protein [Terracidiphilus sp.]
MIIGNFIKTDHGFSGVIQTLAIDRQITIERITDKGSNPKAPDYRVFVGDSEIGAGWNKSSEDGAKHYVSLSIDDPTWQTKLNCTLSKTSAEEGHTLYWSREVPRRSK